MSVIARVKMVREEIFVHAPPQQVWRLFSDIEGWPQWNPICLKASMLKGQPWEVGSRLHFTIKPWWVALNVKATVVESDPPRQVTWLGRWPGLYGQHTFTFEPEEAGTRVISSELFGGPLQWATAFVSPLGKVRELVVQWLAAIKAEAERREAAAQTEKPDQLT